MIEEMKWKSTKWTVIEQGMVPAWAPTLPFLEGRKLGQPDSATNLLLYYYYSFIDLNFITQPDSRVRVHNSYDKYVTID